VIALARTSALTEAVLRPFCSRVFFSAALACLHAK
jgi:hypothetical protein